MKEIFEIINKYPSLKAYLYSKGVYMRDLYDAYEVGGYDGIFSLLKRKGVKLDGMVTWRE